jgi:hypothetical protein
VDVYVDRDSKQYIGVTVAYSLLSGGTSSPTGYTVTVAVVPSGTRPASGDFKTASWSSGSNGYVAGLLVGPGSSVGGLTVGARYDVYAKVSADAETPVIKSPDTLVVR